MTFKFEIHNSNEILIDAPNINIALIRLAMEHNLNKVTIIYISNQEDEEND